MTIFKNLFDCPDHWLWPGQRSELASLRNENISHLLGSRGGLRFIELRISYLMQIQKPKKKGEREKD